MVPLSKRGTGAAYISLRDEDFEYSDHENIQIDNNDDIPQRENPKTFKHMAKKIQRRWRYLPNIRRIAGIVGVFVLLIFLLYFFVDWQGIAKHEALPDLVRDAIKTPTQEELQRQQLLAQIAKDKDRTTFELVAVADRDAQSFDKQKHQWLSVLLRGSLTRLTQAEGDTEYSVKWHFDTSPQLKGNMAEGTRGMELSELKRWHNRLYTFDDRTGTVFEVLGDNQVVPRYILSDGDGNSAKGFKCEWATVKDNKLFVGSIGKEWTNNRGETTARDPTWIKIIDENGKIEHVDWNPVYEKLRAATNSKFPGYMIHEAVEWSDYHKRWFFLPRRVSKKAYDKAEDEHRGSNIIISVSENFDNIQVKHVGKLTKTRGFSTVKFVPGKPNELIAVTHTYLTNRFRLKQRKSKKKKK
jgi:soluble calcium-activated nucleotidase 1